MTPSPSWIRIITLSDENLAEVQMLCGHSPTYRSGYLAKKNWVRERLQEGMRYTLVQVNGHNAGMMETIPGEYAWRGVDAKGYLFIHCFWVVGRNRKHGYGRQLLQAALEDAEQMNGVAVLTSDSHWLPTRKIFIKNGFEVADRMPMFELLVRRNKSVAPLPRIIRSIHELPPGLTLFHGDQCPYFQNISSVVQVVGRELGLPVNIVRVTSAAQAQSSPCPYGVLGFFYNGKMIEYRPIGAQKLFAILKPMVAG
jgi:GNAT superfamily N-acetyltransferase